MNDLWLELYVHSRTELEEAYARADEIGCLSIHHFAEPWNPDGYCVRVLLPEAASTDVFDPLDCIVWDAAPDEKMYGPEWKTVRGFFEASSRVSLLRHTRSQAYVHWFDRKLIHCALNSWGYTPKDETRFAIQMIHGRLRIRWHCWWRKHLHVSRACKYGCHHPSWSA